MQNSGNWRRYILLCLSVGALLFAASTGCSLIGSTAGGHAKPETSSKQGQPVAAPAVFNFKTAMRRNDTLGIREFLAGSWKLDKMCRSTFAGLRCDTSIEQNWQLDSLGAVRWTTQGEPKGGDHYRFVAKTGNRAGAAGGDTTWVLFLDQARRGYIIRNLTRDSLAISDFPLIMDNTTTYYLSR